jgi:acetoin utilization deacetylase AcuC-like enzyme
LNVPLPPGATGDVYLRAFDQVVAPVVERFAPTWLLISAGFDAHRDDPLTELGLTAGDFALLTARAMELVPAGRRIAMLEGGYDLDALAACAGAVLGTLAGVEIAPEAPSVGGPGAGAVADAEQVWAGLAP